MVSTTAPLESITSTLTLTASLPTVPLNTGCWLFVSSKEFTVTIAADVSISKLSSLVVCVFPALSRDVALTV